MSRATLLSSASGRKQSQQRFTSALGGEVCRDSVPKIKSQVLGLEHIFLKDTMELSQIFIPEALLEPGLGAGLTGSPW